MPKTTSPWYSRLLVNLLVTISSLAILFIGAEIVLSLFLPKPIVWLYPQESYVHHDRLIHTLKANQESFTHSFPVKTNSYGLRNDQFTLKSAPDTFRILCLGDSLTFGNGLRAQDTYPKQLESMLNSNGLQKHEVINAGVASYDTWQELVYFREYGLKFDPDLVIVGFYSNDIVPKPKEIPRIVRKSGSLKRSGLKGLVPDEAVYLFKRSRLLLLLRDRYEQLINRINPSPQVRHKLSLLNGTSDPFVERGWEEVRASLEEMTTLARTRSIHLLLVIFPMPDQLLRDYSKASYPLRLIAIAEQYNIHFIDLMPAFRRNFSGFESLFIPWDGHPNARAYKITAAEINRYLQQKMLLNN